MIRLYNTLSREKEPLPDVPKLRLFVCGPTVYDYVHIGNARTFTIFDILARYLRHQKKNLFYLQNITDIDDKIIKRAAEEGSTWQEVAREFEDVFQKNMRSLRNVSVDRYARATDFIPEIVKQVETLIKKGNAYRIDGDGWYFDLTTFPDYGKLARRTIAEAEDGVSRIDDSSGKRNKGDFCLWKFSKAGEPSWKSGSLGDGRPGWHIEDTAITEHFFGPQYEMHGGGADLMFPHHEAEIAQQESASGLAPFVRIWMHAGFLKLENAKMSKSLGNVITIDAFLKKYDANMFRWMVASHHYREPMEAGDAVIHNAEKNLDDLAQFSAKLSFAQKNKPAKVSSSGSMEIGSYRDAFYAALDDDLNTPKAVGALFGLVGEANKRLWELDDDALASIQGFLGDAMAIFGVELEAPAIPANIEKLGAEREISRGNKQFEQSDALRREVGELGYDIEDTPKGPFLWPRPKNHN